MELGANYYIMKPFDLNKLADWIRQMMNPPKNKQWQCYLQPQREQKKYEIWM